ATVRETRDSAATDSGKPGNKTRRVGGTGIEPASRAARRRTSERDEPTGRSCARPATPRPPTADKPGDEASMGRRSEKLATGAARGPKRAHAFGPIALGPGGGARGASEL